MHRLLVIGGLLAACAAPRYSTLRLVGTRMRGSADTLAAIHIDVQGLDSRMKIGGQISLQRTGPDTLPPRWRTYPIISVIDSLRPGSYVLRVQQIGYSPPKIAFTLRPGEVVSLVARMREDKTVLTPVLN